jgi:hypothetical protein
VCADSPIHIAFIQAGYLRQPQSGLHHCKEQRVIALTDPRGAVDNRKDGFDLGPAKEADYLAAMALWWNGEHSLYEIGVLRRLQYRVVEEGTDCRKSKIAGASATGAALLDVVQKGTDQRRSEIR